MSRAADRVWDEVDTGRISEVPTFILEYIYHYGCDDPEIMDLVTRYFERLEDEE